MKNKKIYKILTVILLTVTIFSLVCTNVSAFEKEPGGYVDISGVDGDYFYGDFSSYNIYHEDYALINCGRFGYELTSIPGDNVSWDSFATFPRLQNFIENMSDENSEFGMSYDRKKLKYFEFFVLDGYTGRFVFSGDILEVGYTQSQYFYSGIRVLDRYTWDKQLKFSFTPKFTDQYYQHYEEGYGYSFVVACYFGDYSPYDFSSVDSSELLSQIEELQSQNRELQSYKNNAEMYIEGLEEYNSQLEQEVSSQQSTIDYLERGIEIYVEDDLRKNALIDELTAENDELTTVNENISYEKTILERRIFEMENANAIDEIFTGTSQGLLSIIQGVSGLGYTTAGGTTVTIGGLLVITILGAVFVFFLKLIMGGGS